VQENFSSFLFQDIKFHRLHSSQQFSSVTFEFLLPRILQKKLKIMKKAVMKKSHTKYWDNTRPQDIVNALVHCSGGSEQNITADYVERNGFWGRMSIYWLYNKRRFLM
jgi:hypothetical protein